MTIDLGELLRRRKPEKKTAQLKTRNLADLVAAADVAANPGRPNLVPDTTVYIHQASGKLSPSARSLIEDGLLYHCSVCLAELATGLANRDVGRPSWRAERAHFEALFGRMPGSRLLVPDETVWADAGLVAGTLARTQGFQRDQRKECLNDALIYLTAAKIGLPVLTANRDEFDLIQQLAPGGRFIHY